MFNNSILILMLVFIISSCTSKTDWGKVTVGLDSQGYWEANLENEKIKIRYGFGMGEEEPESFIKEAILKAHPDINIAGDILDGAAHRGLLTKAEIIKDSEEEKSIYLEWAPVPSKKDQHPGPARCEISIFKDSSVIKIKYIDFCFSHVCDIGLEKTDHLDANWGG
jgi:hypothetical protein